MIGVLSNTERHEQMADAIKRGFPMLQKATEFSDGVIQIACFGPSLMSSFADIDWGLPLISVSGAHDFLVFRGWVPTYHVEIDPRPHKPKMLKNPQDAVQYIMASCCHPDFWDVLQGKDVKLWHLINGNDQETINWVKEHHKEGVGSMIGGGSTVGQRAMNVAAALGYRKFKLFGMDCSFKDERHAGNHTGPRQPVIETVFNNRVFRTTRQLFDSAVEMKKFMTTMDVEVEAYGDGLLQEIVSLINKRRVINE